MLALALQTARSERPRTLVVLLALGGGALFYGDSMITPAIPCSARSKASALRRRAEPLRRAADGRGAARRCLGGQSYQRRAATLPSVPFQPDTRHIREPAPFDNYPINFFTIKNPSVAANPVRLIPHNKSTTLTTAGQPLSVARLVKS